MKTKKNRGRPPSLEQYEAKFIEYCDENKIIYDFDEDNTPIINPYKESNLGIYKVGSFGKNRVDCTITAETTSRKNTIIRKFDKKNVKYEVIVEGETEAIIVFNIKELKKMARTLDLKRTNKRVMPTKALEALKEYRKNKL